MSVENLFQFTPRSFFKFFEDEYGEHEKTFDPAHMRDFIDVYLAERQRVEEDGSKDSSFYGSAGKLSHDFQFNMYI